MLECIVDILTGYFLGYYIVTEGEYGDYFAECYFTDIDGSTDTATVCNGHVGICNKPDGVCCEVTEIGLARTNVFTDTVELYGCLTYDLLEDYIELRTEFLYHRYDTEVYAFVLCAHE